MWGYPWCSSFLSARAPPPRRRRHHSPDIQPKTLPLSSSAVIIIDHMNTNSNTLS